MKQKEISSSSAYCKLYRSGSSVVLVIPRGVLHRSGFQVGQTVFVNSETTGVICVASLPGSGTLKPQQGGMGE